jgi:hypothetical protein
VEFDKFSFRATDQEKLLFLRLQQKYQAKTKTELMHAFLADYMKNTSLVQGSENNKGSSILTLQDHSFTENTVPNLYPNNPLLLMMALDREEERERQQRLLAQKGSGDEQVISSDQNSRNSIVRHCQELADYAEALSKFKRACRGL